MNGLYSLAYVSRNMIEGPPTIVHAEIADILATARSRNAENGLTGALLFSEGCFAQVLEGPRIALETVFESIQCDLRHGDVTVLHLYPVHRRSFGGWAMAFTGLEAGDAGADAVGLRDTGEVLATDGGRHLLASLQDLVSRDDMGRRREATKVQ